MKKILSFTTALLAISSVNAADLNTIYQQAVANDAEIAAARAQRAAQGMNVAIARGALLPQAQLSYSVNKFDTTGDGMVVNSAGAFGIQELDKDYTLNTLQIQASQTLFNLNSWYQYQTAVSGDQAAGLELQLAEQQLLLRTAQAYFNVLRAQDNLSTAQAEEKAVKRSLEQTKQRFDVGLIAITDVHEAQAAYDLSYVNLLGQESALDISYEALELLTGQRYDRVVPLQAQVDMQKPQPTDVDQWVESGLSKYPGILLAEAGRDVARLQRNAARSNHMPTVQLMASYSDADQPPFGASSNPMSNESTMIGVQLSVPLLAGGSLYGQSKQAALQSAVADHQLDSQRRGVRQNIRSLYRQVNTDVLNIRARQQAITSATSALDATETGYRVGTRNIVEVLDAQKNLFRVQRDYANARYDYILNMLNLKFFAGTLNEGDIVELNGWLAQQ